MNDNGRPLITATRARGKAANVAMAPHHRPAGSCVLRLRHKGGQRPVKIDEKKDASIR
jgi:hypothetical protein